METIRLSWFFVWRMVLWMLAFGVLVGVLIASVIEAGFYAGGGVSEVVGALWLGVRVGCFFGAPLGLVCGLAMTVLTLTFRRLPESAIGFRSVATALCAGVAVVPAGLLALQPAPRSVGMMMFIPTYFQLIGIPLLISAPFCAFAAFRVAKVYSQRTRAE